MSALLKISNLEIILKSDRVSRSLLDNINLDINEKEIVALVGGSGGGKTSLGLSVLRLLPAAMKVAKGEILFQGQSLLELPLSAMQDIRGKDIAMVFQEPLSAFNPVFKVGDQIAEVLQVHLNLSRRKTQDKVYELLDLAEVEDPRRVARSYPHQLSGGLRQRAMIAQSIAASPKIIIADEPTSNLDVTIQAKILELFKKLKSQLNISMLLITHDLGLVNFLADRTFILHEGTIVESGQAKEVFSYPQHHFTQQLARTIGL